jgi:hypothetical protein
MERKFAEEKDLRKCELGVRMTNDICATCEHSETLPTTWELCRRVFRGTPGLRITG